VSGWLLDTNVISELRRPRPSVRVRRFIASQRLDDLFISTVTLAEIRFGIELVTDPIRRAALGDWLLQRVRPLFDQRVLEVCASGVSWSRTAARQVTPSRNPTCSSPQPLFSTG